VDAAYAAHYAELYRRHWWWRVREAVILAELRRLRPPTGWQRILDVGCGDGLFFDRLAEFGAVEGVEPDTALLDPAGPWRSAIHAVPFDERFRPPDRFDVILMLDVLEHLEHPEAALRHALTLLTKGGVVVITVPALQWLWTRHDDLNHHVMRYDRRSMRRLARAAGLRIVRERYLFQWLVPVKLAVRALEAIRPAKSELPGIPPEPINRLLTAITRLESEVASRIPFPLGNSLLVSAVPADSGSESPA
jgi:2-polyprenyl-3-methyl-5-hydroxy-6-metoxy-1,4-benzoquinol methylase